MSRQYIGRFAPSPSGALHAGSLIAALASFLDARAHRGQWLLRIEDVDEVRSVAGAAEDIIRLLGQLEMQSDADIIWQSQRKTQYEQAYASLLAQRDGLVYPCACSRREIADSRLGKAQDGAPIYPGTCRFGLAPGKVGRSLRLRVPDSGTQSGLVQFVDRWQGLQKQDLGREVGDFVLKRVEGFWAYQMAVVVDDGAQGVTDVVRGVDLLDSTARQIYLQGLLGLPTPRYLHFPVLANASGEKLSKQTGAPALPLDASSTERLAMLQQAASFLQLRITAESLSDFWPQALAEWARIWIKP